MPDDNERFTEWMRSIPNYCAPHRLMSMVTWKNYAKRPNDPSRIKIARDAAAILIVSDVYDHPENYDWVELTSPCGSPAVVQYAMHESREDPLEVLTPAPLLEPEKKGKKKKIEVEVEAR